MTLQKFKWFSIAILAMHSYHIFGAPTHTDKRVYNESQHSTFIYAAHTWILLKDQDKPLQKFRWLTLCECTGEVGRDLSHPGSGINIPALSNSTLQFIASAKMNLSWSLIFHGMLIIRMPGNYSKGTSKKLREMLQQKPALPSSNPDSIWAVRDGSDVSGPREITRLGQRVSNCFTMELGWGWGWRGGGTFHLP